MYLAVKILSTSWAFQVMQQRKMRAVLGVIW